MADTSEPVTRAGPSLPGILADGGPLFAMARALRLGQVTPAELLEQALERIAVTDSDIGAWVTVDAARARRQAAAMSTELAAGRIRGPLHGIPVGVKDLIDVAGIATRAGSRHFSHEAAERIPVIHAATVQLLVDAGAVIVGKTTTHEFAFGGTTPPTRNPADLSRIPGGSSGGSAAAVAAGQVPLALGTDTGGSVRIPSSYCGAAGLVPSPGRLPVSGVIPLAWSLDRVGLIAGTASDLVLAAVALGLGSGPDPGRPGVSGAEAADPLLSLADPAGGSGFPDLAGLRIGVPSWAFDEPIDADVAVAVRRSLALMSGAGAQLREVDIPHGTAAVTAGMMIILAESADYHRQRLAQWPDLFGADVREVLGIADGLPAAGYVRAQRIRHVLRSEMLAALGDVDVLALPTMPCTAPLWTEVAEGLVPVGGAEVSMADAHLRYTVCGNLAGLPCATQPCGMDGAGLPIGLQWVAEPGQDGLVLHAMTAFDAVQAATGKRDDARRPST